LAQARQVVVTGAAGFIGSHLTEALVRRGDRVRAFERYTSSGARGWLETLDPAVLSEIDVYFGDIRDPEAVRKAVAGCERVFHLAALIGIPYSYVNPNEYVHVNVNGTAHVLNAALQCADRIERVVHTSTSECYGTALSVPINEDHPLQAQSPYSASKIAADKLAESYGKSFDLPVVTVRPFNTFGPRQSTRAVIPTIISQVLTSDTVRLGNTTPTRDLTFVHDTAAGFVAAGEAPAAVGAVINLGTGEERSVKDIFDQVCDITGRHPTLESSSERVRPSESEVERLVADASRAHALLGWHPTRSFADGLRATVAWVEGHLRHLRTDRYHV
jgi:dTDP-glucose 4,6-dehydratase